MGSSYLAFTTPLSSQQVATSPSGLAEFQITIYNESKFIAVSVYSTILVCLSATPVYATADGVSQKVGALSVPLLLNVYLSPVCLYLPKMYAIRFGKEVNATRTWQSSTFDHTRKSTAMASNHLHARQPKLNDTMAPKSEETANIWRNRNLK